jgi:hypothetical protein
VKSKKQGASASADSANDLVQVDETVRVPQDLINGKEFKGIELGIVTNLSWRWRRQLIKPSELWVVFYFLILFPSMLSPLSCPSSTAIFGSVPQSSKPKCLKSFKLGSLCEKIKPTNVLMPKVGEVSIQYCKISLPKPFPLCLSSK